MKRRSTVPLLAAIALVFPVVPAHARTMTVGSCSGKTIVITIPEKVPPGESPEDECCRKACHASDHRRKRSGNGNCCS
jgi:hypothetical protein